MLPWNVQMLQCREALEVSISRVVESTCGLQILSLIILDVQDTCAHVQPLYVEVQLQVEVQTTQVPRRPGAPVHGTHSSAQADLGTLGSILGSSSSIFEVQLPRPREVR